MKINKRKIQYASLSTVFIILFVVLVLLANVFVSYMTNRFSLKIDLTKEGQYQLSEQTKKLLHGLDQDVKIFIMESEATIMKDASDMKPRILETIRHYNSESGNKVKYECIDPNHNPNFFNDYPRAKATKEGDEAAFLIIKSDKRYTTVKLNEILSTDENKTSVYNDTEGKITGGILYVTSKDVSKVATITGHNEVAVPSLNTIFDGNNFEHIEIKLLSQDIPKDVNNIVIAGPTVDYTAEEMAKIDKFLSQAGNNLFVFWSPQAGKLPILERFLSDWGVGVGNSVVIDHDKAIQSPITIVSDLAKNDVTERIAATQQMLVTPFTRPLSILWQEKSYTRVLPLATSSTSSFARPLAANLNVTDAKKAGDQAGPFPVAILSEKNEQKDTGVLSNRVFVFGSIEIVSESIINIPITMNNSFVNTLIGYCNENTNTMTIMPKTMRSYDLNFYESQIQLLMVLLLIVMPLAILGAGIFVFLKRRHK